MELQQLKCAPGWGTRAQPHFHEDVNMANYKPDATMAKTANTKYVAWLIARHYSSPQQTIPAWASFNQRTINDTQDTTTMDYLLIINTPAHERATDRDVDLQNILSHELTPVLLALAETANKATLGKILAQGIKCRGPSMVRIEDMFHNRWSGFGSSYWKTINLKSTDNRGNYRRNRRDTHVVPPTTPPCVTTPSIPSRAIPAPNTNCGTHNQIAATTPGSTDSGKMLHNHQIDQLTINNISRISKPSSRYQ